MYHLKWCVQEKTGENYELLIHLYWVGTEQRYTPHTQTNTPPTSLSLSVHITHTHTLFISLSLESCGACVCVPGWYIVCPVLQLVVWWAGMCTCRREHTAVWAWERLPRDCLIWVSAGTARGEYSPQSPTPFHFYLFLKKQTKEDLCRPPP